MPGTLALLKQAGLVGGAASTPLAILDLGAGTGVISHVLQQDPAIKERITEMVGIDIAPPMIEHYQARAIKENWKATTSHVSDAQDVKQVASDHFDAVLAGLLIFALLEPPKGLKGELACIQHCQFVNNECSECKRVLKSGGTVAFSTWADLEWHTELQKVVKAIGGPDVPPFNTIWHPTGKWEDPTFCRKQLEDLGFKNCESNLLKFQSGAVTIDAYLKLLEMVLPIACATWDAEAKSSKLPLILPEFRKTLEARFGDKGVTMAMEAVITTGVKA